MKIPEGPRNGSWQVDNIGNHNPVGVNAMIAVLERRCGQAAIRVEKPWQPGDVEITYADVEALRRDFGFGPRTPLPDGLARFVEWYRSWSAAG
jgi:UDP-glucuronate 4-epimerase